jgi:thioredoxin-dependent peroxiredoxin
MLEVGQKAPPLKGKTDEGTFDLAKHKGKPVVVYFYPKDMTSGCTKQACDFRDRRKVYQKLGATVVGVSRDSVERHAKFREKEGLDFPLVSDEDGKITEAWGVWREKSNYGRKYMGIARATFLIDEKGKIAQIWDPVRVPGHVDKVMAAIKELHEA